MTPTKGSWITQAFRLATGSFVDIKKVIQCQRDDFLGDGHSGLLRSKEFITVLVTAHEL